MTHAIKKGKGVTSLCVQASPEKDQKERSLGCVIRGILQPKERANQIGGNLICQRGGTEQVWATKLCGRSAQRVKGGETGRGMQTNRAAPSRGRSGGGLHDSGPLKKLRNDLKGKSLRGVSEEPFMSYEDDVKGGRGF